MRIPLHVPRSHGLRLNRMLVLVADPGEDEDPDCELAENGIPEKKRSQRRLLNSPLCDTARAAWSLMRFGIGLMGRAP